MLEPKDLERLSDREILVQLRMSVAVLESKMEGLHEASQKLEALNQDVRWMKRIVYSAVPVGPLLAGLSAFIAKMMG